MFKNIIFDLDGTLVDSFGDIFYCLRKAFLSVDDKVKIDIRRSYIGSPLCEVMKKVKSDLKDNEIHKILNKFRFLYDNSDFSKTIVYPGIIKLLISLKQIKGNKLFLVTNKPFIPTKKLLSILDLCYFDDVITPDFPKSHFRNKEEMLGYLGNKWRLEKSNTVIIGDAYSDITAAKKNNFLSIAVLYGYSNRNMILAGCPDFAVENISSLCDLLLSKED
jgi:phosphoglycolate phosphatase